MNEKENNKIEVYYGIIEWTMDPSIYGMSESTDDKQVLSCQDMKHLLYRLITYNHNHVTYGL